MSISYSQCCCCLFFFNDTATTEIYTLSLHDALPISRQRRRRGLGVGGRGAGRGDDPPAGAARDRAGGRGDRKSTRLNSSHANISYAVFCLKKNKLQHIIINLVIDSSITATQ